MYWGIWSHRLSELSQYTDMIVFLHLQYDGGFVDVIHIAFKRLRSGYHAYAVVGEWKHLLVTCGCHPVCQTGH